MTFDRLIGLDREISLLRGFLHGCHASGRPLPSVLLLGAPGTGKTSLAEAFASEAGIPFHRTVGGEISSIARLWAFCESMTMDLRKHGSVIAFIDEIHAVAKTSALAQEIWLPLLEKGILYHGLYGETFSRQKVEGRIMVRLIGRAEEKALLTHPEPGSEVEIMEILENASSFPGIVWVGATTDQDLLHPALRRRFQVRLTLPEYSEEALERIISESAEREGFPVSREISHGLALRCRKTPAEALSIYRSTFALAQGWGRSLDSCLDYALNYLGIGPMGLREEEIAALRFLDEEGPIGVSGLSAFLASRGVTKASFEKVMEPFLMREGLVTRSSRGRMITRKGRQVIQDLTPGAS